MDKHEREVLRRKKLLLAKIFDFSEESQETYREQGLLNDEQRTMIMTESTDLSRMLRFLEQVAETEEGFPRLLECVAQEQPWLRDEMYSDYLAERGDLKIEDYVYRECGMVVHKNFGNSKRISEFDKKEIQSMMALRYQAAKEAYRHQADLLQQERDRADRERRAMNGRAKLLAETIKNWFQEQKKKRNTHILERVENLTELTRPFDDPDNKKHDYFKVSENYIDRTLDVLEKIHPERDDYAEERNKCLQVLKLTDPNVKLNVETQTALRKLMDQLARCQAAKESAERFAESANSKYKMYKQTIEKRLIEQDDKIKCLEEQAAERLRRMHELTAALHKAQNEARELSKEVEWWRKYALVVEKSRRVGYFNPSWNSHKQQGTLEQENVNNNKNHYRSVELMRSLPDMQSESRMGVSSRQVWQRTRDAKHTPVRLMQPPVRPPIRPIKPPARIPALSLQDVQSTSSSTTSNKSGKVSLMNSSPPLSRPPSSVVPSEGEETPRDPRDDDVTMEPVTQVNRKTVRGGNGLSIVREWQSESPDLRSPVEGDEEEQPCT